MQRISTPVRLAYGVGAFGPAMAGSTLIFYQMLFMTDVAGLGAMLAGAVMMTGRIWDAVNDPLVGWLSDHTRTRLGRRLPWMIAGILPLALGFVLLLWVPPFGPTAQNQWGLFAYFCLSAIVLNVAYTAVALPHQALLAELTEDYDERTRLAAFRQGAELAGSVGGLLLAVLVFSWMENQAPQVQYLAFGLVIAAVMFISVVLCMIGIWKPAVMVDRLRRDHEEHEKVPFSGPLAQWKVALGNRPFLIVCAIFLCSWLAMQFTATILPYYVKDVLRLPDSQFRVLALVVQSTALLVIPVWSGLCVKFGKKAVYYMGMSCWIVAQSFLFFLPPGGAPFLYVLGIVAGLGISVCYLVPTAMLPDVIELDELQTGRRREGVFYGFLVLMQKMALALGTFIVGWALQGSGYIAETGGDAVQPDSALFAIRLAIGPVPTVVLLLGIFCAWKFPITRESHAKTLAELHKRRNPTGNP